MSQLQTPEGDRLNPERVLSSSSPTDDNEQSRFTFVHEKNQPGALSHAMRAHWQERKRRKQEGKLLNRTIRPLRSKSDSSADLLTSASRIQNEKNTANSKTYAPPQNSVQDSRFYAFDTGHPNPIRVDKLQLQDTTNEKDQSVDVSGRVPGVPAQLLTGMNYALSSSRLDPFDVFPVILTPEHQKLIHHWLITHATMMFGKTPASDFNPMRDVWFPLDLSNAASFNAIMAYSAAHLAYFYGGTAPTRRTNSSKALKYKLNAIEILSQWMNDPEKALSNDAFAGSVRLLTFERYWGTEEEWKIHRDGIQRMIEARGGLHELHSDWRLELVVGLVSLMSQPSWFSPTNNISSISYPDFLRSTILGMDIGIKRIRSIWLISFIQDMRNLMSMSSHLYGDGLAKFPTLHDAVLLILSSFKTDIGFSSPSSSMKTQYSSSDYDRLEWLFSMSILVQESITLSFTHPTVAQSATNDNSIALLDMSLFAAPRSSKTSVHALLSFLRTYYLKFGLSGADKFYYIMQMTEIVTHLSLEAQLGIEKCLLNMFCRTSDGMMVFDPDDRATPDSLLSSVHGH
ncbi:hypothetical protein BGW36DRAFT_383425 [Talaromyces proteolyticus]|uniref:Tachykinin family protein n=1 Tax=Talaromyces proteolyticus TaxID=1131652 RepID=A0AAD4PY35_9EURO|nr:uncharacterized protein BGW36DRAFT_383425 [Talaromyces proteolyticus]KAH8693641.1 hypothetical protein BGW36DRAFT_383425 [Talaromyces proteolyticus]